MACVLFQEGENGNRRIISCGSAKFTPTERKYHINEQETLAAVWAIKRYAAYLEHKPFTLYTDSRALTWLHRFKDEKAKLTRWALMLQAYQFKIVHVPGRLNELPDHLSRYPDEEPQENQPTDDIRMYPTINQIDEKLPLDEYVRQWQAEDEECIDEFERLSNMIRDGPENPGEEDILQHYVIRGNVIWRKDDGKADRLYVPLSARERVVYEYHAGDLAGHPGRDETLRRVSARYYWPRMNKDVANVVKLCETCVATKRGAIQPAAPLRPQRAEQPWEVISVDVLGPYPKTSQGYQYVIIAEDVFSKWIEAAPSVDGKICNILNFLEHHVFARWGYPKTIITDNGAGFRSNVWIRRLEELHIKHRTSPIYRQRGNPVERRVQELKKILRTREDPRRPNKWERHLADALFCLRTRTNAATNTTPSELLLGYQLRRPGEEVRESDAVPQQERQNPRVRSARVDAARDANNAYQNKIFPPDRDAKIKFVIGDAVMTRADHINGRPFRPTWTGPWRVTGIRGDNTYEVEKAGYINLIHVDDLRKAVPQEAAPGGGPPTSDDEEDTPAPAIPGPVQPQPAGAGIAKDQPRPESQGLPASTPGPDGERADAPTREEEDSEAQGARMPAHPSTASEVTQGVAAQHPIGASEDVPLVPLVAATQLGSSPRCMPAPTQSVPANGPPTPAPRRRRRARIIVTETL